MHIVLKSSMRHQNDTPYQNCVIIIIVVVVVISVNKVAIFVLECINIE